MTSKKTPSQPTKPNFSPVFKQALQALGGNQAAPHGVAEAQAPYTPPKIQPALPAKKPAKGKPASWAPRFSRLLWYT